MLPKTKKQSFKIAHDTYLPIVILSKGINHPWYI